MIPNTSQLKNLCLPIIVILALLTNTQLYAQQDVKLITVTMKRLYAVTTSEFDGDELILYIQQRSANGETHSYLFPEQQDQLTIWKLNDGDEIDNLVVWQQPLYEGEDISLTFHIIEQDDTLFNTNDVLQSIRLLMDYDNAHVRFQWQTSSPAIETQQVNGPAHEMTTDGLVRSFRWKNNGSDYLISFKVEQSDRIPF